MIGFSWLRWRALFVFGRFVIEHTMVSLARPMWRFRGI
jgi:hypothetical protein